LRLPYAPSARRPQFRMSDLTWRDARTENVSNTVPNTVRTPYEHRTRRTERPPPLCSRIPLETHTHVPGGVGMPNLAKNQGFHEIVDSRPFHPSVCMPGKIKTFSMVDHDKGSPSSLALLTSQRSTQVCGGMGRPTQEKTRGFIHGFMCLFELLLLLFFSLPCEPLHFWYVLALTSKRSFDWLMKLWLQPTAS
jgi:hypothetical protein